MYYHARVMDSRLSIGRAESPDGIAWRQIQNHVLQTRSGWERVFNADPFLLVRRSVPEEVRTPTDRA